MEQNNVPHIAIHNEIYKCFNCLKVVRLHEKMNTFDRCHFVSLVRGMQPSGRQNAKGEMELIVTKTVETVCSDCFTALKLTKDPSRIVMPNFIPPKDLQEKLRR